MVENSLISKRLDAMIQSFNSETVRWVVGKGKKLVDDGKLSQERYDELLEKLLLAEMEKNMIAGELESSPLTVGELANRLRLPPKLVLRRLISMRRWGAVAVLGEKDHELLFRLS